MNFLPLFDKLDPRACECKPAAVLENWLIDWSELSAAAEIQQREEKEQS